MSLTFHLTCAIHVIKLPNERVKVLYHHFFLQFLHVAEIGQKAHVLCISQILTTFNLYSGRPMMGLLVENKQNVKQAIVNI